MDSSAEMQEVWDEVEEKIQEDCVNIIYDKEIKTKQNNNVCWDLCTSLKISLGVLFSMSHYTSSQSAGL